ncbi:MAG: response regulator [Candidatus Wallbacteria bacterium]|nr:response regulator [Candidatus Wallbacteria bacterium]
MSFRTRLLLLNLVGCLLPLVVLGALHYRSVKQTNERVLLIDLRNQVDQQARVVAEWFKRLELALDSTAKSTILRESWQRLLLTPSEDDEYFPQLYALAKNLSLMLANSQDGIEEIFLAHPSSNEILVSNDSNTIGRKLAELGIRPGGKPAGMHRTSAIPSPMPMTDETGRQMKGVPMCYVTGVLAGEKQPLATLGFRVNLTVLQRLQQDGWARTEKTDAGELASRVYLVDERGRFLTRSREQPAVASSPAGGGISSLDQSLATSSGVPMTYAFEQCGRLLAGESVARTSNLEGYRDHRGVSVIGAWLPVASSGWFTIAEMPAEAARGPLRRVLQDLMVLLVALVVLSLLIVMRVSRAVARPLVALTQAASRLSAGERGVRCGLTGTDEIGQLSRAFDSMAAAVENSVAELTRREEEARHLAEVATRTSANLQEEMEQRAQAQEKLKRAAVELETKSRELADESWLRTNVASLTTRLQRAGNVREAARTAIAELAPHVEACAAAMHLREEPNGDPIFVTRASYASYFDETAPPTYREREGLVGECGAGDGHEITVGEVPQNSLRVRSGALDAVPGQVLLLPARYQGKVHAVLEVASIRKFTQLQRALLVEVADALGVALQGFSAHERTEKLLEETQSMAQMLSDKQDRLREANADLGRVAQQLEQASKYKSEFLANMSHEIRTPMNAIIGLSYLALKEELPDKQRDRVGKISQAAKSLLGIVNDVLDFSKIEAGKLAMETIDFDLDSVLQNLRTIISLKTEEKGLELLYRVQPDITKHLRGDPLRLGQVLLNLATNAVKFTKEGEIEISVRQLTQDEGHITLSFAIRDTGIGITTEQASRLFGAFEQADSSTTRHFGGTGLGLAISKRLVEMMGGNIAVNSQPCVGSTFSFIARFGRSSAKLTPVESIVPKLAGLRTLVVDDNPTAREIEETMLASFGMVSQSVGSGEAALSAISGAANQGRPFNVVLMDWKMPGLDGLETTRLLNRDRSPAAGPAVVMVSSAASDLPATACREAGVQAVIAKPMTLSSLLDGLMQALYGKAAVMDGPSTAGDEGPSIGSDALAGVRILVAEDNEMNRMVAGELLSSWGAQVAFAHDGRECVEKVLPGLYDIVLMDVQMPEMDGYEATRALRAREELAGLPIVGCTANVMAGDAMKCTEAGMNSQVGKPIQPRELYDELNRWLPPSVRARKPVQVSDGSRSGPTQPAPEPLEPFSPPLTPAGSLEQLTCLDLAAGLSRVAGNRAIFTKLLTKFAAEHAQGCEPLRRAVAQGGIQEAGRRAHSIRGVAGNLGIMSVAEAAKALETAAKNGELVTIEPLIDDLELNLAAALEDLTKLVAVPAPAKVAASATFSGHDGGQLRECMATLRSRLKQGDVRAREDLAALERLLGAAPPTAFTALQQRLDDFDFEGALSALGSLETQAGLQ